MDAGLVPITVFIGGEYRSIQRQCRPMSAVTPITDKRGRSRIVRFVPIRDIFGPRVPGILLGTVAHAALARSTSLRVNAPSGAASSSRIEK